MLRCVDWYGAADVSEVHSTLIFCVKRLTGLGMLRNGDVGIAILRNVLNYQSTGCHSLEDMNVVACWVSVGLAVSKPYIHTNTHIYTYIYTYIHAYIHTYTYVHTYIHTYIHTYVHRAEYNKTELHSPSHIT
jgi:hypothetical protein